MVKENKFRTAEIEMVCWNSPTKPAKVIKTKFYLLLVDIPCSIELFVVADKLLPGTTLRQGENALIKTNTSIFIFSELQFLLSNNDLRDLFGIIIAHVILGR